MALIFLLKEMNKNRSQDHARSKKFNNYPYYVLNSSVYGDLEIMVVV